MSIAKIYYSLREAENRTAELYSLISLNTSLKYPELSTLFESLGEDEKLHARQIDMMHQVFEETEDSFVSDAEAERRIGDFLNFIEDYKKYFLKNFETMNTGDILSLALGIENNLVEKHRHFFVRATDPGIRKLFENLTFGDQGHIQKIQDFELK